MTRADRLAVLALSLVTVSVAVYTVTEYGSEVWVIARGALRSASMFGMIALVLGIVGVLMAAAGAAYSAWAGSRRTPTRTEENG